MAERCWSPMDEEQVGWSQREGKPLGSGPKGPEGSRQGQGEPKCSGPLPVQPPGHKAGLREEGSPAQPDRSLEAMTADAYHPSENYR